MQHSIHIRDVCEFGVVHSECRCAEPNKTDNPVKCTDVEAHKRIAALRQRDEDFLAGRKEHNMKLTDTVHYVSYGTPGGEYSSRCRAAMITEVLAGAAMIFVMNPTGVFLNQADYRSEPVEGHHVPGSFHYPDECMDQA